MQQSIIFDPDLIRRFDIPGPRYTSYPTADRFLPEYGASAKATSLGSLKGGDAAPLSLYFHIPFCNTICYYCACNKIITKDRSLSERYISYLEKEMAMQAGLMPLRGRVTQMHWGGGTPTFLASEEITRLMSAIRRNFDLACDGEFSIEVDPRKVSAEVVAQLASEGFNRMSVGVQDFDPLVQAAVNRIQTVEETSSVMSAARATGFRSISVDLIYGLPHQTVERFARTLDVVLEMAPERLALYNYAHLPTRFMPQRRINEADLPRPEEKLRILALAIERLDKAGYVYIGMDHFARPDDELAVAQREGLLQRNFQGYSTHADCDLLAFGVSSIGRAGGAFSQNHRELEPYYAALDRGELPVLRGWELTAEDKLRNAVIQTLMCDFELDYERFRRLYGVEFPSLFGPELEELEDLAAAGLLEIGQGQIRMTGSGRMLVRIVAMVFDQYLRSDREKRRYSRVI